MYSKELIVFKPNPQIKPIFLEGTIVILTNERLVKITKDCT